MNAAATAILDVLKTAHSKEYPWVHGQRLQGVAGIRYGARLDELRKAGWPISAVKAPGGGGWYQYKLDSLYKSQRREAKVRFDLSLEEIRQLAAGVLPPSVVAEAKRLAPNEQKTMF